MRTLRSIRLLIALSVATVGLAAYDGPDGPSSAGDTADATGSEMRDDSVVRAPSADDNSCLEQSCRRSEGHIINGLPQPLALSAPRDGWTCAHWSGVSTPRGVLNGKVLQPGARSVFRLELDSSAIGNPNGSTARIGKLQIRPHHYCAEFVSLHNQRLVLDQRIVVASRQPDRDDTRRLSLDSPNCGRVCCWICALASVGDHHGDLNPRHRR